MKTAGAVIHAHTISLYSSSAAAQSHLGGMTYLPPPGFPGSWGTLGTIRSPTRRAGSISNFGVCFVQACTLLARHWEKEGGIGGSFCPPPNQTPSALCRSWAWVTCNWLWSPQLAYLKNGLTMQVPANETRSLK